LAHAALVVLLLAAVATALSPARESSLGAPPHAFFKQVVDLKLVVKVRAGAFECVRLSGTKNSIPSFARARCSACRVKSQPSSGGGRSGGARARRTKRARQGVVLLLIGAAALLTD
jgi:hypothetical protein